MRRQEGITLIALVIIIIVVGIVIFAGLKYAKNYVENQEVEDIKASMLAIQGVITNVNNKHTVD